MFRTAGIEVRSHVTMKLVQKTHIREDTKDLSDTKEVTLFDVDGHGHATAVGNI